MDDATARRCSDAPPVVAPFVTIEWMGKSYPLLPACRAPRLLQLA